MTHPNEKTIRQLYDAFARGDTEALTAGWTDDVVWHSPGQNPLAGSYDGPEAVLGFFGRIFELTDNTFRADLEHTLADDHTGYALHKFRAQRDGRDYEGLDVLVMRFQDGRVAEFWVHPHDQALEDEMFA